MDAQAEKTSSAQKSDDPLPTVSFLGPISSYTHQVYTLSQYDRPAWSIGLTDRDLAQASLQCFDPDRYAFQPATTITGDDTWPLLLRKILLISFVRCL